MNTHIFGSVVDKYNRDLRIRRLKRAFAWFGIVAAGSLLLFCVGAVMILSGWKVSLVMITILALLAWGSWGAGYLATRH
jgi:hypothetical protein